MLLDARTYLLLASLLASSNILVKSDSVAEDCGETQHDVENGMIRLPDFSGEILKDINCSWTYVAPPGRKLLVKVDNVHLPPSDLRTSLFQLYIDDQLYDIPRNCVKCLREMVGGKIIKVSFASSVVQSTESPMFHNNDTVVPPSDSIGSFQVRYKSFDPHRCSKPEQIENGLIVSKGRKIGQSIFYRCNAPYDLFGESESQCMVVKGSPVPEWSSKVPLCSIQDCTNGPVRRVAGSGSIASPGYPSYMYAFDSICQWVIIAQPHQQIKLSVTYLRLPSGAGIFTDNSSRLSLLDGDSSYIVNLTESLTNGPLNFTTLTNKLTVQFFVNEDNKRKEEAGFYLDYFAVSSSCPTPRPPKNGEVIDYTNNLGSVITYQCDPDYVLVGELHAECLLNGQWSHPSPTCESLTVHSPVFVGASNDSDTVKFAHLPRPSDSDHRILSTKPPKSTKKKAKEFPVIKTSISPIDLKTQVPELTIHERVQPFGQENAKEGKALEKSMKKNDKENGPKSEPHLLQVIPPKDTAKKSSMSPASMDGGKGSKYDNVSRHSESFPHPGTGISKGNDSKLQPVMSVTMISIIAGVGAPAIVAVILLVAILIYRRRYPVRMRFGRKFSTFENPMYITKDAQHPRELRRLTT